MVEQSHVPKGPQDRDPEGLLRAMRERRVVLLLQAGAPKAFAVAHSWEDGRFVSHSSVFGPGRSLPEDLEQRVKEALNHLSRRRWPHSPVLCLTLSMRTERLHKSMGFIPVPYCDLTTDSAFWKACEGCVHHGHLKRNQYQDCHCWAGLLPTGAKRERVIPKDALIPPLIRAHWAGRDGRGEED